MQTIVIAASLLVGAFFSTNVIAIANVLLQNGQDTILTIVNIIK
jgi:hypothetical protein